MTSRLSEPTTDEQLIELYNRGMRIVELADLDTDQLYALVLFKLNNSVTPANYPDLKTAIEAITGIQEVSLVIDHHTRPALPAGKKLLAVMELNLRIESI